MAHLTSPRAPLTLIGTSGDPRVDGFQAALARGGHPWARMIDYRTLLREPGSAQGIRPGSMVRVESPGRDPEVLAGLLAHGITDSARQGEFHLSSQEIQEHLADRGRLLPARQLYRGLCALLDPVEQQVRATGGRLVPDVAAIRLAFDKSACSAFLAEHNAPVPRALGAVPSFDALISEMRRTRTPRVFIKLQHGSAASGSIALAVSPHGMTATTTVERVTTGHMHQLYNTRRVRRLTHGPDIAELVDALIPYGVHLEQWVPKAGAGSHVMDLRLLVVAGEPAHGVLRKSRHPMTNLHLGGERADAEALLSRLSDATRAEVMTTARRVATLFPGALHLGLDIAVTADLRHHYVLEVNVFGDLLKGALHQGLDPYELQVRHLAASGIPEVAA